MPEQKKYLIEIPDMPEGSGIWDAAKWERHKDAFMKKYPTANVFEVGQYDANDTDENDQFMLTFENDPESSGIWDASKWERHKDAFTAKYPDAQVNRVRYVDYWGDAAKQNRARREELNQPDPERDARLAEIGYFDDVSGERKQFDMNSPAAMGLKPVSSAIKQNSVSGETEYLDPKVAEFYANDTAYTERLAERARLDAEYESNPSVVAERKWLAEMEKEKAAYVSKMREETQAAMEKNVDKSAWARGYSRKHNPGVATSFATSGDYSREALAGSLANEKAENYKSAMAYWDKAERVRKEHTTFAQGAKNVAKNWWEEYQSQDDIETFAEVTSILKRLEKEHGNLNEISDEAIEKSLTEDEKYLVRSFFEYNSAMAEAGADMTKWYKGGQIAAEAVPFMLEILATGGLYKAAGDAAVGAARKGLAKWIMKSAKGSVARTAKAKTAKVLTSKAGQGIISALAGTAARTAVAPGTYTRMAEAATHIDDEGHLNIVKNMGVAAVDAYIENLSEESGIIFKKLFGIAGKGVKELGKALGGNTFARMGQTLGKNSVMQAIAKGYNTFMPKLEALGFHGLPEEIGEEILGNALREATFVQPGALKEMFVDGNFGTMLIGFAPMTILGAAGSAANIGYVNMEAARMGKQLRERMSGHYRDEQINLLMSGIQSAENAQQVQEAISPIIAAIERRKDSGEISVQQALADVKAVYDYGMLVAKNKAMLFAQGEQNRELADAQRAKLFDTYGKFWREDAKGNQLVQTARLNDGRSVFVLSEPAEDGKITIIDMKDGKKGFANTSDIAQVEVEGKEEKQSETATRSLDRYIDGVIASQTQSAEAVRMGNERNAQIDALRSRITEGTKINLGTEGSPVIVIARGTTREGVRVVDSTGAESLLGWEQAADALGTPIKVKTDKELVDEEIAAIAKRNEERRRRSQVSSQSSQQTSQQVATDAAKTVQEENKHIPLNEDGTVNEAAFWEQSPEEYAAWNDEQNQDGGADTLEQIANAKNELAALVAQAQSAVMTSNPATRKAAKREVQRLQERLARIEALEQKYLDRAVAPYRQRAQMWMKQTGAQIHLVETEEELAKISTSAAQQSAAGGIVRGLAKDGKAYIYLPGITSESEVDEVFMHETVAHLGLLGLLGQQKYDELCAQVWQMMSEEARRTFLSYAGGQKGPLAAADEYIAHIAERIGAGVAEETELTVWEKIMEIVRNFLRELGFNITMTEQELSALLTAAYADLAKNMKSAEQIAGQKKESREAEAKESRSKTEMKYAELAETLTPEEIVAVAYNDYNAAKEAYEAHRKNSLEVMSGESSKSYVERKKAYLDELAKLKDQLKEEEAFVDLVARTTIEETGAALELLTLQRSGFEVDEQNDDARFSVRYLPTMEQRAQIIDSIVEVTGQPRDVAERWLDSELSLASIVLNDKEYLDYAPDAKYKAIKDNSDYPQGTVDFNNICRKRKDFTRMYTRLQRAYPNRIFTAEDLADIRTIMSEDGLTVACGLCYVEDRRQKLGEVANAFIEDLQNGFRNYAKKNETKRSNAAQFMVLVGGDTYVPSIYDLITLEGSDKLYEEHRGIWEAFGAYNRARGQQTQNTFQGYAEYKREILSWSDAKVKKVNSLGGLRIFSYSDFEAHHLLDIVQIIIDCSARGVMIQGYTKVPEFARVVEKTGIKLNRSLIPLGDTGIVDGKLAYDPVEGIDINDPNFLESNDNVGNILIGINDEQIRLAMADPFIHYIIPYHARQAGTIRAKLNVGAWTNYIDVQNERDINTGKRVKDNINIYTEVLDESITNDRQFVEKYLEVCREKGFIPKFDQFLDKDAEGNYVYTPGYYKFLVDFKLFDEAGNILPQKPVVAQFDDAFNAQILEDYAKDEKESTGNQMNATYDRLVSALNLGPAEREDVRFSIAETPEEWDRMMKIAEDERGYVFPGLHNIQFPVVKVGYHTFRGKTPHATTENARQFLKSIQGTKDGVINGRKVKLTFNSEAVGKLASDDAIRTSKAKGGYMGGHLAVVENIFEIIEGAYDVEIHPNIKKINGKRDWDEGLDRSILIHRYYAAVSVEGDEYRVMILTKEYRPNETDHKIAPYTVEVEAFRLERTEPSKVSAGRTNHTTHRRSNIDGFVSGAKLLKGVEKSYDPGVKVLDVDYFRAVEAGDMETAQRMVDEAAEAAGYTIRGDHGRVSKFTIFDRDKANPEGDWGKGFYFTNNEEDVENNYASVEGPDLEAKIEREVERRVNLAEMNEEFNEDGEVDEFAIREEVEKEFITSEPNVVHAAIKMDNPFVVGHGMVEISEDGLGHYDMQETYLTAEYETDEDGEADYSIDPTGTLVDLVEALNDELSEYEGVNINAYDILSDNIDGMTASQFEKEARELLGNSADYLLNDDLAIMTSEIIRAAIERAGFDGIVDNTVNQKFGTVRRFGRAMEGVDENTRHYVAFQSSQIKETDAVTYDDAGNVIPLSQRFNPENEDIRFSIRTDEQREKLFEDAKAHYGVTKNFNAAGYMLPDGSLLDFSEANDGGDPNSRSLDHRDIEGIIMDNGVEYDSRWMYIADFMNEGAIRLLPESAGINMIKAPTEEQRKKIFDFIYKYNGEVILEINDDRLNSVAYMEYDRRTSPARIFRDIDGYFNQGIVPEQDVRFSVVFDSANSELEKDGISFNNEVLMNEYGLSDIVLSKNRNYVTLSKVVVADKNKGNGTRFMNALTNVADENGWTLALTPDDSFGASSVSRLKKFYKRFGFKDNKGKNADFNTRESMIRTPEAPFTGDDDTRFSVRTTEITPEVRAEMDIIAATAIVNGNYMKAPNGADTNLTAEQWAMVRTKNFKAWFGDWENDPENASKVVDKNGEPMVVYHGTGKEYGFTIFNTNPDNQNLGSHFGTAEAARVFDSKGNHTYEVFLNIRNPWSSSVEDFWTDDEETYAFVIAELANHLASQGNEEAAEIYNKIVAQYPMAKDSETWLKWFETGEGRTYKYMSNQHISLRRLLEIGGYDGWMYENFVEDAGSISWVALSPNQIKSATDNTGAFSNEEEDIRFSITAKEARNILDNYESGSDESLMDEVENALDILESSRLDELVSEYRKERAAGEERGERWVDVEDIVSEVLSILDTLAGGAIPVSYPASVNKLSQRVDELKNEYNDKYGDIDLDEWEPADKERYLSAIREYLDALRKPRFSVNENPTEAQKEAGNYKMGHLNLDGYRITIENPKGSVRRGTDSKGNAWENTLNNDYGYIRGTEGVDGDHIDVYLSDNPSEGNVFVIDQVNPETREFDEHKVMYGFNSAEEAREAYLANFSEGWNGLGTITEVSKDEFKKWIQSSHRKTKPFSEYKSVNAISSQSEGGKAEERNELTAEEKMAINGLFPGAFAEDEDVRFSIRRTDETAEEFTQRAIDDYRSRYAEIVPMHLVEASSRKSVAAAFGVEEDELPEDIYQNVLRRYELGDVGFYFPGEDKFIIIFARDEIRDGKELEDALIHENIHALINTRTNAPLRVGKWLYDNPVDKVMRDIKDAVIAKYPADRHYEEMLTNWLAPYMVLGGSRKALEKLPVEYRPYIQYIYNELGYDSEREDKRRRAAGAGSASVSEMEPTKMSGSTPSEGGTRKGLERNEAKERPRVVWGKPETDKDTRLSYVPAPGEIELAATKGIATLTYFNVGFDEMRRIFEESISSEEQNIARINEKPTKTAYDMERLRRAERELMASQMRLNWWNSVNDRLINTSLVEADVKSALQDTEPRNIAEYLSQFFTMRVDRVNSYGVDKDGKPVVRKVNKKVGVMLTPETLEKELGWSSKDWSGIGYIVSAKDGRSLDAIAEMISEDADAQPFIAGMDTMDIKNEIISFIQSVGSYTEIRDYIKNERTKEAQGLAGYVNGKIQERINGIEESTGMSVDEYNARIISEAIAEVEDSLVSLETSEIFGNFEQLTNDDYEGYIEAVSRGEDGGAYEGAEDLSEAGDYGGRVDSENEGEPEDGDSDSGRDDSGSVGDRPGEAGGDGVPPIGHKAKGVVPASVPLDTEGMSVDEIVREGKMKAAAENADAAESFTERINRINNALAQLRSALAAQRSYDKDTVRIITNLANDLLQGGRLSDMTRGEIKRLLSVIKDAVGKEDLSVSVDRLMDIMIANQLRFGKSRFEEFLKIKATKVNASGVEARGKLDVAGQQMMQYLKEGIASSMTDEMLSERIATEENNLDSESEVIRGNAENKLVGYYLARLYRENIKASEAEEKDLREEIKDAKVQYDAGMMDKVAYKEFIDSCYEAIRENRMQRVNAFESLNAALAEKIAGSIIAGKMLADAEKARIERIHHFANSDMEGMPSVQQGKVKGGFWNNTVLRFLFKPLATFDQMLRSFAPKSRSGEGYLWNHFMGGWLKASENEFKGIQKAHEMLDEKVRSVFKEAKRWSDLFAIEKRMPTMDVKFWDGEKMADFKLTQGNLLYIYMVSKMTDGKMKLSKMGITDVDVRNMVAEMDPRFIELADWIQESFLPALREKYNEVHVRLFGAPMAAIDNYFPIRVLANARTREVDLAVEESSSKPSTITGSIIKRTKNSLALDILGSDAFDVVLEHVEQMEHWAAFAEFNKDLNTLLSYNKFRNRVQNSRGIYGAGTVAWNNFRAVAEIAAGVYKPAVKSDSLDKLITNIAKGVTGAKISFRVYTALKQFLSAPAFVSDASAVSLIKSLSNPYKAWTWAMNELPLFEKRWKSRQAGDSRLMETEADWELWKNKIVELAGRYGMTPNAFVDALTVSIGARAIYETKLKEYLDYGYSPERAEEKAKRDATVLFNESQQSNESAFLSAAQVDRTVASILITVFRNSSMGYQRMYVDGIRNLKHMLKRGYREQSIEFMKKQMVRDGLEEDKAARAAERIYNRSFAKNAARVATFGFLVQFAWNLGPYMAYLLMGDDDEEKKDMITDAAVRGVVGGPVEGLAAGQVISTILGDVVTGEDISEPTLELPATSDLENAFNQLKSDPVRAVNDMFNLLVQSGIGVNPQTITDAIVAIVDACNGDMETSKEVAFALMRILQTPQSQIDKLYKEEIGFAEDEGLDLRIHEFAERYAKYKVTRNAPLAKWLYSDEREKELEDRFIKRFLNDAEDLKRSQGSEEAKTFYEYYDVEYKKIPQTLRDLRKQAKENPYRSESLSKEANRILETDEFKLYEEVLPHIKMYEHHKKQMKEAPDGFTRAEEEIKMREEMEAVVEILRGREQE